MELNAKKLSAALKAYAAGRPHGLIGLDKKGQPTRTRYSDGRNLYLTVAPTGAMSWVFLYADPKLRSPNGRPVQREVCLGSATGAGKAVALSLDDARLAADQCRLLLKDGRDIIADRRSSAVKAVVGAVTFADMLDEFLKAEMIAKGWKLQADGTSTKEREWRSSLRDHATTFAGRAADEKKGLKAVPSMSVAKIDYDMMVDLLTKLRGEPKTFQMSEAIRFRIEKVLAHASAKGKPRHGMDNPAVWEGNLETVFKAKPAKDTGNRQPALPYRELQALVPMIAADTSMVAKQLLFTALTAVRLSQTLMMTWSQVNLEAGVWMCPAENTKVKNNGVHEVPLSRQAIELLRALPRRLGSDLVFWGNTASGSLCRKAGLNWLYGKGLKGQMSNHGFRSMFEGYAKNVAGAHEWLWEEALHHAVDATKKAYNREQAVELRRTLMQSYADYCFTPRLAAAA